VTDTLPPDAIVELKLISPEPTPHVPWAMTVEPVVSLAAEQMRNPPGVPDATAAVVVMAERVSTPLAGTRPDGVRHGQLDELGPASRHEGMTGRGRDRGPDLQERRGPGIGGDLIESGVGRGSLGKHGLSLSEEAKL
jgi:hypothetical protein